MRSALPTEPTFFAKPSTALLPSPAKVRYPSFTHNLQHEIELIVRIERTGSHISLALGIDLTARDLQATAKANGMPWLISKGFDGSAVFSPFVTLSELGKSIDDLTFSLQINGNIVQSAYSGDMIFHPDRLIAHLSQYITLTAGDLIYTGTPAGVGTLHSGDHLVGILEGSPLLTAQID